MYFPLMEKQNFKSATKEVRESLRLQVKRLRKAGRQYNEITEITGLSLATVKRYAARKDPTEKKRGRSTYSQQKLSQDHQKRIIQLITDKTPDQYKLPFALWTRKSLVQLIKEQFDISICDQTAGDYLKIWGFTCQKAELRSYEQKPEAVRRWHEDEYPAIKKAAASNNAEIYWVDETGIRNDDQRSRGFSPKGKTPTLTLNGKRFRLNMISAVNNKGKFAFMVYEKTMRVGLLIKFLVKLHKSAGRKIVVILDNLRVHHALILQNWLSKDKISKRITVHYLPSYSPELNPDEYFNGDLKGEINRRPPVRSQKEIEQKVIECAEVIAKSPERIANYFKHPKISYAAE